MFARLEVFQKHKTKAIDLSKQQALDANRKTMQQINFTGNLSGNITLFCFNIISI